MSGDIWDMKDCVPALARWRQAAEAAALAYPGALGALAGRPAAGS